MISRTSGANDLPNIIIFWDIPNAHLSVPSNLMDGPNLVIIHLVFFPILHTSLAILLQSVLGKHGILQGKGEKDGKVHPRIGHEGPEGKQSYSSTLSLTSALDGGGWSMPHSSHFMVYI